MNETKLKERLENTFAAFFDDERLENNSLTLSNQSSLLYEKDFSKSGKNLKKLINILRQVFLYFPGVVILNAAVFFLTVWHTHPNLGFGIILDNYKYLWIFSFLGVILTTLGIGDIRKPKHLLIPTSTIAFSFLIGIIFSFSGYGGLDLFNALSIYQVPFALTIPFLVRMWLEQEENK